MRRGVRALASTVLAGLVLAGLAGCGASGSGSLGAAPTGSGPAGTGAASDGPGGGGPSRAAGPGAGGTGATGTAPGGVQIVQVWLMRGGQLFYASRTVTAGKAVGRAAMTALLAGPTTAERAAGVRSAIPAGTGLLGLSISGGVATVDLSAGFSQAGAIPAARLAQVVYTLTQFPTVSQVRFEIGGTGVTAVAGIPVRQAQTRAGYASWLPPITVSAPLIGTPVTSPVTVTGTADVFEAAVSLRVLGASGNELDRSFTTASCGTGCRGGYTATLTFSVSSAQAGTIEVYEVSPKDGTEVHVQSIPVTLLP